MKRGLVVFVTLGMLGGVFAGSYEFRRDAGDYWQDALLVGNGSHAALAYAPSHLEWVINKVDVLDHQESEIESTPHDEVMAKIGTNRFADVECLAKEKVIKGGGGKSVSPAVLRARFWNGAGWNMPSIPLTRQTLDMKRGELVEKMVSPDISPSVTSIAPHEPDALAFRFEGVGQKRPLILELERPVDPRLDASPTFSSEDGVLVMDQQLPSGDRYAVAMLVGGMKIGAPGKGLQVRLSTKGDHDVFLAVRASRFTSDYRAEAVCAVRAAAEKGFAGLADGNAAWWNRYWDEGGSAELTSEPELDRAWKYAVYAMGAQYGGTPMCPLNGLVYGPSDAGDAGVGSHFYFHDQNTQIPMMQFFPLGRFDFVRPFVKTYLDMAPQLKALGRRLFGEKCRGIFLPLNMNMLGYDIPAGDYRYTLCGSAYSGIVLVQAWKHSRERKVMEVIYPLLKEFVVFYVSTASKGEDGRYHLIWSVPPEIQSGTKDELCCVACLKSCLETAIAGAELLGVDGDLVPVWRDFLAHYPQMVKRPEGGWWCGPDIPLDHFMFGGHLFYPFFPAECDHDRAAAEKTLAWARDYGAEMSFATVPPHPSTEWGHFYPGMTRLRLHDAADGWSVVTEFYARFHKPNGMFSHNPVLIGDWTHKDVERNLASAPVVYQRITHHGVKRLDHRGNGGDMTVNSEAKRKVCPVLEGGAAFVRLMTEALLQSWDGEIKFFPAVPKDFTGSFRNFRSSDGRRVSAEMRDGVIVSKRVD